MANIIGGGLVVALFLCICIYIPNIGRINTIDVLILLYSVLAYINTLEKDK